MILRCTSSHARSHSSCAPIKTTQMLLPSYKKNNPSSFAFVFLKGVSWKQQAAAAVLLMRTLSSLYLITSTFFPLQEKNSANLFRVLLIP
jgi:hypothetical protein